MACYAEGCQRPTLARGLCGLHYKRFMRDQPLTGPYHNRQSIERGGLEKLGLHKNHSFYMAWVNMKTRCDNLNSTQYEWYGGRGITYEEKWSDFAEFFCDMYPSWRAGLTLERVKVYEGYSKTNCCWIPACDQASNRRPRHE